MAKKIKNVTPPHGVSRLLWRAPIWIFRIGLGGLLGKRFLLLNHIGRKSGKIRQAVIEVVHYDRQTMAYTVASGFGAKSDWFQNVMAHPDVTIQVGSRKMNAHSAHLTPSQAENAMLEYNRLHPETMRTLAGIMGYEIDNSEEDVRFIAGQIPLVEFRPTN